MQEKFTDQIGNTILLSETPKRIVSLVPSQTELLFDLGLENEVVGITKFCIHPDIWFRSKTRVGGTKNVNFDKISELTPDLIIANKEENTEGEIKELMTIYPTWVSDIKNLDDAIQMINNIGKITKTDQKASEITKNISFSFNNLAKSSKNHSVLYLIWNNPFMSINQDTFINEMIEQNGWINYCKDRSERYPEITIEELKLYPDIIFLSSEPFPFKQKHLDELQTIFPNSQIHLVDGEMFSWYGSRLLKAPEYFKKLQQIVNLR